MVVAVVAVVAVESRRRGSMADFRPAVPHSLRGLLKVNTVITRLLTRSVNLIKSGVTEH
jgi:hypothetical protein